MAAVTGTGFSDSDLRASLPYGYRSKYFRQPTRPIALSGGSSFVKYNGFVFPPICNVRATMVPEYNKNGSAVKSLLIAVTVDCVVTDFTTTQASSGNPTIDNEMDVIRKRLTEPGQALEINLCGLGTIKINTGGSGGTNDLEYGPKPQVLEWEPIAGSGAANLQWLVTTKIPNCIDVSVANFAPIDVTYNVEWNIDEGGFLSRSVTLEAELAARRLPSGNDSSASTTVDLTGLKASSAVILKALQTAFPELPGFHKREKFKILDSKRKILYSVSEDEIRSPLPYAPGIVNMDLEETISSSLKDGFQKWKWTLSGSFEVQRGKYKADMVANKGLAYSAFGLFVRDRIQRTEKVNSFLTGITEDAKRDKVDGLNKLKGKKVTRILSGIKIANRVASNQVSVNVDYLLICPVELIFAASGMFDHVRVPGFSWDEWQKFRQTQSRTYADGFPGISQMPSTDIVVDPCHPLTGNLGAGQRQYEPVPGFNQQRIFPYTEIPDEDNSWLKYDNQFVFYDENDTVIGSTYAPAAKEIQEQDAVEAYKEKYLNVDKSPLPSKGDDPAKVKPYDVSFMTGSHPIAYVMMIGSAIRLGYGINAPSLIAVGGAKAIKTGTDMIVPTSRSTGYPGIDQKGNTVPQVNIHRLSWKKLYAITSRPTNWRVNTTGNPEVYV